MTNLLIPIKINFYIKVLKNNFKYLINFVVKRFDLWREFGRQRRPREKGHSSIPYNK